MPAELSIVAWDDSAFCEVVHPPLTALTRDVAAYGAHAARALVQAAAGAEVGNYEEPTPVLTVRGSTGPAPRVPAAPSPGPAVSRATCTQRVTVPIRHRNPSDTRPRLHRGPERVDT